jgi:hypothetical protein
MLHFMIAAVTVVRYDERRKRPEWQIISGWLVLVAAGLSILWFLKLIDFGYMAGLFFAVTMIEASQLVARVVGRRALRREEPGSPAVQ